MRPIAGLVVPMALALGACVFSGSLMDVEMPMPAHTSGALASGEGIVVLPTGLYSDEHRMVLCVRETLQRANPALRVIPAREFRNALFPWFEADISPEELAAALAKPLVRNTSAKFNVRYAVTVGDVSTTYDEPKGTMPYIGSGVGWVTKLSSLYANIWDLKEAVALGPMRAAASGSEGCVGIAGFMPCPPYGWDSDTARTACEGLGKRLAHFLAAGKLPPEPSR